MRYLSRRQAMVIRRQPLGGYWLIVVGNWLHMGVSRPEACTKIPFLVSLTVIKPKPLLHCIT